MLALPTADWRRQPGCPRITWLSNVQRNPRYHHLMLPETADMAQKCPLWRMLSTYGATQSQSCMTEMTATAGCTCLCLGDIHQVASSCSEHLCTSICASAKCARWQHPEMCQFHCHKYVDSKLGDGVVLFFAYCTLFLLLLFVINCRSL